MTLFGGSGPNTIDLAGVAFFGEPLLGLLRLGIPAAKGDIPVAG